MVFQDPMASFSPKMKTIDILTEPLLNFKKIKRSEKEEKAKELLRMVELPDELLCRYPHSMSGGQRQRVGIARALALDPEVLVCDEATSALDVSVQEKIVELLVKLQRERGISMVFICHDVALVQSLSHTVAVIVPWKRGGNPSGKQTEERSAPSLYEGASGLCFFHPYGFFEKNREYRQRAAKPGGHSGRLPPSRIGAAGAWRSAGGRSPSLGRSGRGHQTACHLYRP